MRTLAEYERDREHPRSVSGPKLTHAIAPHAVPLAGGSSNSDNDGQHRSRDDAAREQRPRESNTGRQGGLLFDEDPSLFTARLT